MMRLVLLILFFPALSFAAAVKTPAPIATPEPDWKFVARQLKKSNFKPEFITAMKNFYNPESFIDILRLNVLLFLKKADYHGPQVTNESAIDVADYIRDHRATLTLAEQRYKVPPEVIVSLLWMESRLGNSKGTHHVPSVYLDLIQAQKKSVIAFLKTQTDRYTDRVSKKQMREIGERAKRKSQWALGELKSIQKVFERKWDIGPSFTGSFAGAFGLPQFIPSSYVLWARPFKEGTQPILSNPDDAIMSVAFYLKDHGHWRASSQKRKVAALMSYNNSRDYALAILDLAKRTTELKTVASESPKARVKVLPADEIKPENLPNRMKQNSFGP